MCGSDTAPPIASTVGDHLGEALGRAEAEERQAGNEHPAEPALEFQMEEKLVAEMALHRLDQRQLAAFREADLQKGDRRLDLQRVKGRVVPGVFVERR